MAKLAIYSNNNIMGLETGEFCEALLQIPPVLGYNTLYGHRPRRHKNLPKMVETGS